VKKDVCRKQQLTLETAYNLAIDAGLLEHDVLHRYYDYAAYYDNYKKPTRDQAKNSILLDIVLAAKRKNTNKVLQDLKEEDIY
jgi:hypothetical protein